MIRRARQLVIAALTVGGLALLAGCQGPIVIAVPTHPAVADIEGTWTSTRTLTSTDVENDGLTVGDTVVRDIVIAGVTCDETGGCTGTISSSATDQSGATTSTLKFADGALSYAFDPEISDCTKTDGTVVAAKAYTLTVDYDLRVSKGDSNTVTEFSGTSGNTVTTAAAALAAGCSAGGHREFDVVLTRTP